MHGPTLARTIALALFAAPLFTGCGGQAAATMPAAANQDTAAIQVPLSDDVTGNITSTMGIRLTGESSFNSPTYGTVLGYFKGRTSMTSQVVTLPMNRNVVFVSVEPTLPHTASFLGDASASSAPWPKLFNGSQTQAKAGTAIGTTNWSTGALSPGKHSLTYTTGAPGFYMIGCAFHYNTHGMRTVIIVKT
jgi:plastocyanin